MKRLGKMLTAAIGLAAICVNVNAAEIRFNGTWDSAPDYQGNQTSTSEILAYLQTQIGPVVNLYRANVGGAEEYNTGLYSLTLDINNLADESFRLNYTGPAGATGNVWLLVKDGNQTPAWYLWQVPAGTTVWGQGFWPQQGGISFVGILGGAGVPDGGTTLALMGMGLAAIGWFGRKKLA